MNLPNLFWLQAGVLFALLVNTSESRAQTRAPAANRLPPPGITIPEAERDELVAGAAALRKEIDSLKKELAGKPAPLTLLPDIEIFHKAVDWALRYDEFFDPKQVAFAKTLLR